MVTRYLSKSYTDLFPNPFAKSVLTSDTITEKNNAVQKPPIANPGTIFAASKISSAFKTNEKSPNVTIFNGSVSNLKIGRKKTLIIPNTTASTTAPITVEVAPGNK